MKSKTLKYLAFALVFGVLGYFREFFFMNVNNLMYKKYYGDEIEIPRFFSFLESTPYVTLYYLKYVFTVLSFLAFYGLSYLCIKSLAKSPALLRWLNITYLVLLALCGLAMLWAYFVKVNLQDDEYTFSRWLMGIAQSPLPALFLLAGHKLNLSLK